MLHSITRTTAVAVLLSLAACESNPSAIEVARRQALRDVPLRDVARTRGIEFGAAADRLFRGDAEGTEFKAVLSREFGVLTPENDMKHRKLQPARGRFDFARADSLVDFAAANRMLVRGHTLVWHYGYASWMTNRSWTPDEGRALLTDHVRTVVGHFAGRVVAWDVVNEALNDDGTLRSTLWTNLLGPDYIALAFRTAHEADPQAALFYNDYNIEGLNAKSDAAYALLARLLAEGVPIHGIGMQGHFQVGQLPPGESMSANIARFAALGLKVHFTEVDIRVPQPATTAHLQIQAENYGELVDVCLQHAACEMIVTWGVSDRDSWISRGGAAPWGEPLLLDGSYRPKPAYWSVHERLSRR